MTRNLLAALLLVLLLATPARAQLEDAPEPGPLPELHLPLIFRDAYTREDNYVGRN